jgi:hypothetical protein
MARYSKKAQFHKSKLRGLLATGAFASDAPGMKNPAVTLMMIIGVSISHR